MKFNAAQGIESFTERLKPCLLGAQNVRGVPTTALTAHPLSPLVLPGLKYSWYTEESILLEPPMYSLLAQIFLNYQIMALRRRRAYPATFLLSGMCGRGPTGEGEGGG